MKANKKGVERDTLVPAHGLDDLFFDTMLEDTPKESFVETGRDVRKASGRERGRDNELPLLALRDRIVQGSSDQQPPHGSEGCSDSEGEVQHRGRVNVPDNNRASTTKSIAENGGEHTPSLARVSRVRTRSTSLRSGRRYARTSTLQRSRPGPVKNCTPQGGRWYRFTRGGWRGKDGSL